MRKPPSEGPSAVVRGCITANFPKEVFTLEQLRAKLPPRALGWSGLKDILRLLVMREELKTQGAGYQRA